MYLTLKVRTLCLHDESRGVKLDFSEIRLKLFQDIVLFSLMKLMKLCDIKYAMDSGSCSNSHIMAPLSIWSTGLCTSLKYEMTFEK